MIDDKTDQLSLHLNFKRIVLPPKSSMQDKFDVPLPISQNNSFYQLISKIIEFPEFDSSPELIIQFYELITENNSELTFNNIVEFEIIPFLLQLLTISADESILKASLKIISMLIDCSYDLFKEFILNDLLFVLPDIYTYPSPKVQTIISRLYTLLTDPDRTSVHIILECTSTFIKQSVQWAACHSFEDCRKNCLIFQFNIIVGSDKTLPRDLIYDLSRSLKSILVCENISLVALSAWCLGRLIQSYSLTIDFDLLFKYLFQNYNGEPLIDSEACIPVLRMIVKAMRNAECIPEPDELLPILEWPVLIRKMISSDNETSYLCCRICQNLIQLGAEYIDEVLSNEILDTLCLIYNECCFKSMCEISLLLTNIWKHGSIEQQKTVFCHQCFLLFLKFIQGAEMIDGDQCFLAMHASLKSISDIDKSFISTFAQNVPSYFFDELIDHTNEDISNCSQNIIDIFYPIDEPEK